MSINKSQGQSVKHVGLDVRNAVFTHGPAGSTALTAEQVSTFEKYTKDVSQYSQEQAIVFQAIASMIPHSLYLKIKGKPMVKEAWDVLKADFKRQSRMITIELQKKCKMHIALKMETYTPILTISEHSKEN